MSHYFQSLLYTTGYDRVGLRELTGREEQALDGANVRAALRLVNGLLDRGNGLPDAEQLASADRDRILAGIYQRTYGDRIASSVDCRNCGEPFDLDFELSALLLHAYAGKSAEKSEVTADGFRESESGLRFRLPTGADEMAVIGLGEEEAAAELLRRCCPDAKDAESVAKVSTLVEEIAPMLTTEVAAHCPECGHELPVHFDVQSYLLQALLQDQKRLGWEVHRIASAYKWSLGEILDLPRSQRRNFAAMIEEERSVVYG